jgi:phosphatidylserine/phosphatidylglycerophosphate/cardiolipin synthase-like enzyme
MPHSHMTIANDLDYCIEGPFLADLHRLARLHWQDATAMQRDQFFAQAE